MTVAYRAMADADYDAVRALWQRTEHVGLGPSDERSGVLRYLERNPGFSHVAEIAGGRIIAAALAGDDGRRGMLTHVAVDAEWRGRGVGRELVRHCLAAMRNAGLTRCDLLVFAANEPGRAFWRELGWQERPDILWMKRDLDETDPLIDRCAGTSPNRTPPAES